MTNKDLIEPIEHINAMCKCLRDLGCVSCPLFEQIFKAMGIDKGETEIRSLFGGRV